MSNPEEEPKLIVDEDWKTQVQREKEELKRKQEAEETLADSVESANSTTAPEVDNPSVAGSATEQRKLEPPPPASFTLLVTTLATQAMAAMGLMPAEDGQAPAANLEFAKHFIDMLSVLEEKTKGNLAEGEKSYLSDALHQLRMAFVAVSKPSSK